MLAGGMRVLLRWMGELMPPNNVNTFLSVYLNSPASKVILGVDENLYVYRCECLGWLCHRLRMLGL